ncbi:UBX domain-containing protein 10 [Solea senegalensis]|uniref:UBX domain-containing protein 10 n=1 Tax=Solea senegalensis TaxID=28829 RepID=A0AAV6SNW8_SOLSE|nr:UBX domain-containing protein 10 [Solea senegalensis]KAG7519108.1 UBX domain-containing protein 10 [Solea senegalensis]
MHLTRPKSSKGRSRPAAPAANNDSPHAGDHIPGSPESAVQHSRRDRNLRSQSQPTMSMREDQVLHLLRQRAPDAPPQSLNKYKVLPSIERRRSEVSADAAAAASAGGGGSLDQHMSALTLSGHAVLQRADGSHRIRSKPLEPEPGGRTTSREAGANGSLLLAIRAPCGRRFEQHFESTDTLLTVRASAEVRFGHRYGEAFIETMDVPRRSFTDMDMTLDQCDIVNRSVLCITLNSNDSVVQHE